MNFTQQHCQTAGTVGRYARPLFVTLIAGLWFFGLVEVVRSDEPLLRDLPAGIVLKQTREVPATQAKAIGQKLGGEMVGLTNSDIVVHGRAIQVNVLVASNEIEAKKLHDALLKIKPADFCARSGRRVIEYVGNSIDAALCTKTSFEIGVVPKPEQVTYQIDAELATIEKADYMACNPLFNFFLADERGDPKASDEIQKLSQKFTFGQSLKLRAPLDSELSYTYEPAASKTSIKDGTQLAVFANLPRRHGVPFVRVAATVAVNDSPVRPSSQNPGDSLVAATPSWPVADDSIRRLADEITKAAKTDQERVQAVLEWLQPGRNIQYAGRTGSRWGTLEVLQRKSGHCWDFSDCFVTLSRAAGVPTRQVAGWLYGSSGHVWAEVFLDGQGWVQVDPTGGGQMECGLYHIPYFTSEDGEMPIVYLSMPRITIVETKP